MEGSALIWKGKLLLSDHQIAHLLCRLEEKYLYWDWEIKQSKSHKQFKYQPPFADYFADIIANVIAFV